MQGIDLQNHIASSVAGGGMAQGPMQGIDLQNHIASSAAGGGSAQGPMQGIDLQNHIASVVAGGGIAQGPMQGIELEKHKDRQAQGKHLKHYRMMQVANGRTDQENLWKCVIECKGSKIEYRFDSDNDVEIVGVRKFEQYLLDDLNGYGEKNLTTDGKAARKMMEQQRQASDKLKLRKEGKRARQDE
jgi:hypothetical protein